MRKLNTSLHTIRILFNEVCLNEDLHDNGREDKRSIHILLAKMEGCDALIHIMTIFLGTCMLLVTPFLLWLLLYGLVIICSLKTRMFLYKQVLQCLSSKKYRTSSVIIWMRVYTFIYSSRFGLIEII